jgi:hypothetical protein
MKIIQKKVSSANQTTSLLHQHIFSFATSIKAEERILFYDKISSNDKIRLGYWLWSSRTFL